ncbi:hypothetical protein Tco_1410195 [Tanacetum coccineum]
MSNRTRALTVLDENEARGEVRVVEWGGDGRGYIGVGLDLSRLATTLNRLERSYQTGINKWYQSLLRNSE